MTNILNAFDSAQATALVAFFIAAIQVIYSLVKPFIEKKINTEKNEHVKQSLELGLKFANAIIPELAVMQGLSKTDRKKEAIKFVGKQLSANGFDIETNVISGLVESAFQAYKVSGGDNHAPIETKGE